jgi:hypothetical protein
MLVWHESMHDQKKTCQIDGYKVVFFDLAKLVLFQ